MFAHKEEKKEEMGEEQYFFLSGEALMQVSSPAAIYFGNPDAHIRFINQHKQDFYLYGSKRG